MKRIKVVLSGAMLLLFLSVMAAPGYAAPVTFTVSMSGPAESPANSSLGVGSGVVIFDIVAHTLQINVVFSGLGSVTTASHIHCCTTVPGVGTAGVATQTPSFTGFPLGVTSGSFSNTFDMTLSTSYNSAFITANGGTPASAEAALFAGALAGKAYLNIHTTQFGGGEIRGFLTPVSETSPLPLIAIGLASIVGYAWHFRRN